jgi:cytochrome c oxidase subunit 2
MKKSHRIIGLFLLAAAAVLVTWGSVAYDWFPELVSPSSEKFDDLYKWLLIGSVPFFVIIVGVIAFEIIEFRAKGDDDDRDGEPIHGSTKLEIVWTLIPTLIVIALGLYAWAVLDEVEAKQDNELRVHVIGQQFAWSFEYIGEDGKVKAKSNELIVPKDRALVFDIDSVDVVHSFWVPAARLKRDATPGVTKQIRFRPVKLGNYDIVCTELCGIGHATMRQTMRVVPKAEFQKWYNGGGGVFVAAAAKKKADDGGGADSTAKGKAVFTSAGCGGCHVFKDAGAAGQVGPTLEGIGSQDTATLVEMIVEPDKEVAKGYSKGIMPPNFGDTIPKEDLDALVAYLQQAGK